MSSSWRALPSVELRAGDGACARVFHHGAHVTSWRPAPGTEEQLYLSERSSFAAGAAIRGGVPVIFPQFAAEGPLPRHGFARAAEWRLGMVEHTANGDAVAELLLADTAATRAVWPVAFLATLTVRVGGDRLALSLSVENRDDAPLSFTAALHTYLRVRDVTQVVVEGLAGVSYRESSAPGVLRVDDAPALRIAGEVDRVYVGTTQPVRVHDGGRTLRVEAVGFRDTVLWNPGAAKAAALADLDPGGEREMLCVESGVIQRPEVVPPGSRWAGTQTLVAGTTDMEG